MENEIKNGLVIDFDGTKRWYYNDVYHRFGGPAIEYRFGGKHWFQNGRQHRLDGPAYVSLYDQIKHYYVDGVFYSESEFNNHPLVLMYRFVNGK